MSKTIKFRGKSVKTKDWVYGYLFFTIPNKPYIILGFLCEGNTSFPISFTDYGIGYTLSTQPQQIYLVHPDSVGQATGVFDKNNVEIYGSIEINGKMSKGGDIVKSEYHGISQICCGEFQSHMSGETSIGFYKKKINGKRQSDGYLEYPLSLFDCFEVIGNQYDNPEMLEKQ